MSAAPGRSTGWAPPVGPGAGTTTQAEHQGQRADRRADPVGHGDAAVVGEQPGDRVAETDARGGDDREGGDHPAGPLDGQVLAGRRHRQRHQGQAEALEARGRRSSSGSVVATAASAPPSTTTARHTTHHPLAVSPVAEPADQRARPRPRPGPSR